MSYACMVLALVGSGFAVGWLVWITWRAICHYDSSLQSYIDVPAKDTNKETCDAWMQKFGNVDRRWFLHVLTGLSVWLLWLTACFAVDALAAIQQKAELMILHRVAMVITTAFLAALCICLATKAAGGDR